MMMVTMVMAMFMRFVLFIIVVTAVASFIWLLAIAVSSLLGLTAEFSFTAATAMSPVAFFVASAGDLN